MLLAEFRVSVQTWTRSFYVTQVISLQISEPARLNKQRIKGLLEKLGEQVAQELIQSALDEIALSLADIQSALACRNYPSALRQAGKVADLGWQIGLPSLAGVARNLGDCLRRRNEIAVAAVCSRLLRIGELSLVRVRQLHESGGLRALQTGKQRVVWLTELEGNSDAG